jgi:hypothetical protein
MFTTVDEFKANVSGIAVTNKFLIDFSQALYLFEPYFPNGTYKYLVKDIDIPPYILNSSDSHLWGKKHSVIKGMEISPIDITFICDKDMKIRHCFENWMNKIFDRETFTVGYFDEYVSDIVISVLNGKLQTIRKYTMEDAYPEHLSQIALSHDGENTVMTFTSTFICHYWKSESIF